MIKFQWVFVLDIEEKLKEDVTNESSKNGLIIKRKKSERVDISCKYNDDKWPEIYNTHWT